MGPSIGTTYISAWSRSEDESLRLECLPEAAEPKDFLPFSSVPFSAAEEEEEEVGERRRVFWGFCFRWLKLEKKKKRKKKIRKEVKTLMEKQWRASLDLTALETTSKFQFLQASGLVTLRQKETIKDRDWVEMVSSKYRSIFPSKRAAGSENKFNALVSTFSHRYLFSCFPLSDYQ